MKKIFLFVAFAITLLSSSCRITKTATMMSAKNNQKRSEAYFVEQKKQQISFLKLSDEQLEKGVTIWKTEKQELDKIDISDNSQIAPIIYKSEVEWRKILNDSQLVSYTNEFKDLFSGYFLNDRQMEEIKRIYGLKY